MLLTALLQIKNAWRNVIRHVDQSRPAFIAIMLGMAGMIVGAGFIDWNITFGKENFIRSQLGHIQIIRPGFLEYGRADPADFLIEDQDEAASMNVLSIMPGIAAVAPRLLISGLASAGETTLSFIGEGVDPIAEQTLSSALRFSQGETLTAGEKNSAIVGLGLAENLQLSVGSQLILVANGPSGGIRAVEVKVVGIFTSMTKAYDDNALRVPIELARELMGYSGAHYQIVLLDRTDETDKQIAAMRSQLPAERFQLVPWYQLADFFNKTASLFERQLGVIYVIIGMIMVLSIANTMLMNVTRRISEIGTMMAMGSTRRAVLGLFLAEGMILGVIGSSAGLTFGSLVASAINQIGIPMPPGPTMTWGYEAGIELTAPSLLKAALIALFTTLGASIYPSWKASRLNIVDALRTKI